MTVRRAFVSLGSNIEPRLNVARALEELRRRFVVTAVSPIYRTAPVGDLDQPDYWNLAVELACDEAPELVHEALRGIEARLGRRRDPNRPYGPRTMDLDLVLVDGLAGTFGPVTLPSPQLAGEAFVALPVADLAAEMKHPESGLTLAETARATLDQTTPRPIRLSAEEHP